MWGWGFPEDFGFTTSKKSPSLSLAEMKARKEALDKIEKEGRATCKFCEEEIVKNDNSKDTGLTWESEFMLSFCEKSTGRNRSHEPLVEYKVEAVEDINNV